MDVSPEPAARRTPASGAAPRRGPLLWAVASGKGGVGKSVVSSSLAIGLAQTGPRAVAADLDLGGANLHNLFGGERAPVGVADLLRGSLSRVEDALTATTVPGVKLLSGARGPLDAANPNYAQKQKLLRALRRLDAGHVVVDLGAGSGFNTLDAFLAADRRILVVTPEKTSIENAYHFLKAAFFRSLRAVAQEPEVRRALTNVLDAARQRAASPRELVEAASAADAGIGQRLRTAMRAFEVDLVVNRCETISRDPGPEMAAACRAHLGARVRHAATLPHDASVPAAVSREVPVMQLFPAAPFCVGVEALVARLLANAPLADDVPGALAAAVPLRRAPAAAGPSLLPGFDGLAPGRYLRICRELQRMSLDEVAERTRIRHIESIEAERFDSLPPDPYLREFVRQYAALLGVADPAHVAARFIERAQARRAEHVAGPRFGLRRILSAATPSRRWRSVAAPAAAAPREPAPESPTPHAARPRGPAVAAEALREDPEVDRLVSAVLGGELERGDR